MCGPGIVSLNIRLHMRSCSNDASKLATKSFLLPSDRTAELEAQAEAVLTRVAKHQQQRGRTTQGMLAVTWGKTASRNRMP